MRQLAHDVYHKIAEPRFIRVSQFVIYLCVLYAGAGTLLEPSHSFQLVVGDGKVYLFGGLLVLGSILGAVAVLPGIWWLERTGIIALGTGLAMYFVIASDLDASPAGIGIILAFGLTFVQRWREIRGAQLAPKER